MEFVRRLHWEALCGGLGRARARLVVGDGAAWIWNVAQDRWKGSTELLDFYRASEHLWGLGRALNKDDEATTARWAQPLRHQLRHGSQKKVLAMIAASKVSKGEAGKVMVCEQNYFATHSSRINYQTIHRRGCQLSIFPCQVNFKTASRA